ncbi:MAG: hypothetical protein JSR63_07945 [Proteobacteria bacterium]|nr:hypothetical protein [Pseudomonadota bacterium]
MATQFVRRLRSGSNYPVFRIAVKLLYVVGYLAAAVMFFAGITSSSTATSLAPSMVMFAAGIGVVILTHLAAETTVMLADIADATTYMAETSSTNTLAGGDSGS